MKFTKDNLPKVATHWTEAEQGKCLLAANAVMEESKDEEQATMACIVAAGKSKIAKQRATALGKFSVLESAVLTLNDLGIEHDYSGVIIDRRKFADGSHTFEAEIFAVGTWNGMRFTVDDLTKIAANFKALEPYHKVPLKFGHNSEQPLTDGQPALGWVTAVYVKDSKLMAIFSNVPDVVRKAIEKKLYRKVSVELDIDVEHKGKKYDYVLSGVALLGADIPAVSVLADLDTYIGAERLAASRHSVFSAISGQGNEEQEDTMSLTKDEVQKLIADGMAAALKPLQDQNAAQTAELAQFKADDVKRKDADKQAKVKLAREAATKILEDAVKANAITPAQRDTYARTLGIADDDRVLTINLDDVKQMIPTKKTGAEYSRETANGGNPQMDTTERVHEDAGQEIVRRANFLRSQNPKLDYAAAQKSVLAADPELAKEWLGAVAA